MAWIRNAVCSNAYTRSINRPSKTGEERVIFFLLGGKILFCCFGSEKVHDAIAFIKTVLDAQENLPYAPKKLLATGGGAYKYADVLKKALDVELIKKDEMECLIKGANFLILTIPYESFSCASETFSLSYHQVPSRDKFFPYILVNIGSGVSIIKVSSYDKYERISGTSLGGGTFWGLMSLLTTANTFDEALVLSEKGNNQNIDLLVGDIYGTDYAKVGLAASTIASSSGKIPKMSRIERKNGGIKEEDTAASLLNMISNNIGQIAYLNAQLHGVQRIYFGGFFIRGHAITIQKLSFAIDFWSKGSMKAYFLRHEGYLGSLGAFLNSEKSKCSSSSNLHLEINGKNFTHSVQFTALEQKESSSSNHVNPIQMKVFN